MTVSRQIFEVSTDTGTWGDTGPNFSGQIVQVHWNPTTVDTGADLTMALLPRAGDTGDGFNVIAQTDVLGTNFQRVPGQRVHDAAGVADTGLAPVYAAGDRLRVKVTPGGAACAGRLYVWIAED